MIDDCFIWILYLLDEVWLSVDLNLISFAGLNSYNLD